MTNEYKENLLKYLTGNIGENESSIYESPYYEEVSYTNKTSQVNPPLTSSQVGIKCKDSNGNYNGMTLFYYPVFGTTLTLVDENMETIMEYYMYDTGTPFYKFMGLKVDEEGRFYGVDYDEENDKFRFILLNNLSEPTKTLNGYTYKATLRNSYFIQGYTEEDDVSRYNEIFLQKSRQGATYYIGFTDSTSSIIMPTLLTINVGAANEWKRLNDVTILQSQMLDYYIYFDNNDNPTATYFIRSDVTENIERIQVIGEETSSLNTLINWSDITTKWSDYTYIIPTFKALSDNTYYLILSMYWSNSSEDTSQQKIVVYKNTFTNGDPDFEDTFDAYYTYARHLIFYPMLDDNNNLALFYRSINYEMQNLDLLHFVFIPYNTIEGNEDNKLYKVDTNTTIVYTRYYPALLSNSYNLNKAVYQSVSSDFTTVTYTTIDFIYNENNYNTLSAQGTNMLVANQGLLYDTDNSLIFARNLYNNKIYNNKTISVLNVPNNKLNGIVINKNKLISYLNDDIKENNTPIEKNVYEDLYINYFNTLSMQDRNGTKYIDNPGGAIRINQSTGRDFDYDDAKASKIRINYLNGTYDINYVSATINNNVATYIFTIYVPEDKMIDSIDIISNDENTIYQTIYNTGEFMNAKYYKISQDVYVE